MLMFIISIFWRNSNLIKDLKDLNEIKYYKIGVFAYFFNSNFFNS